MNNICNICGANYVYKNGKWVCPACDNIKQEEITNEEVVLLTNASTKLRMADFDDAEELYRDCIKKYPNNAEAYWGLLLSRYGIKYEEDLDGKKVPTVYATSIESILDDKDYKKAISLADKETEKYYKQQAQKFESIRQEWVDKASKEPPFDIFICFKDSDAEKDISRTDDSYEAQNLYTYLMSKGYSVFFSRESLRDKVAERYEPYIFNALNTAHIMIVYSSSKEYLESTWVKNEWSRFLKKIKNKQKQENSLILAYEKMKPSEFPKGFNSVQCMDASQKTFYSDLEKHINKVINKAKAPVSKIERVDIQENIRHKKKTIKEEVETREIGTYQVEQLSGDEETQVKTAYKFLSKKLFADALEIFDRILSKNERNGQAILGKTLARLEVSSVHEMISIDISEDKFEDIELAISYSKKADALNILAQLKDTCISYFNNGNYELAKSLMQFILQYKSENEDFFDDIRKLIISLVDNRDKDNAVELFDFFLKYRSINTDMYLQELKSFIALLMRNYYYKTANTYYEKYIEIFPNDTEMLWKGILININCPSDEQLSRKIVNFKHFDKFETLLSTLSKGAKRQVYVNSIIEAVIEAGKHNDNDDIQTLANIFENILKYTESNKNITDNVFEFAKVCQVREEFDLAEKYYALLIGEDEHNHKAYWGLLQSKLKAANNTELIQQPVIITTLPEFHSAIVAAGDDDKSVDRYIELKAKQLSYLENQKIKAEKRKIRRRKIGIFSSIVAVIVAVITGFSGWKMYYNANNTLLYTLNSSGTGYVVSAGKYYNEKSITIPRYYNGKLVTEIATNAFKDKDLEYVSIPNTVEKIGNNAFYNCDNLKNINLNISESKENSNLNDGVVIKFRYPLDNYTIIKDYHETEMQRNEILNQWEIHKGIDFASTTNNKLVKAVYDGVVTSIYNNVTDGYVVEITHNNSLKTRYMSLASTPESYVYEGATVSQGQTIGLTSNTKKDSYRSNGYVHFEVELDGNKVNPHDYFIDNSNNSSTTNNTQTVTYENKLATIGEYAFYNCSSLEEFKTCNTITTIGAFAFANCSRLEGFELPAELKRIEAGTFQGAFGYKDTTISLHDNIEFVGSNAFDKCTKLIKIEVSERDAIPESWDSNWKGDSESVVEWTMNITFDYQGATANNTVTKTSVTTGKPYQLPIPTKEGYIFDGWYSNKNGEGTHYAYANGYSVNNWSGESSIKVYANWIANNNSIIFNGNGATSGTMENFIIPSGESKALPENQFVRNGYTFAGWATTSNGDVVYEDCDDYVMGINPTNVLYAIWTANTNELSFNGNGPNMGNGMIWGSMDDISVKTDETITLPANTFIKNGYRFAGWATTPSGNVVYPDRSQYTMGTSSSVTLYAKWQPIDYTITLVLNGGTYNGETVITYNAESEPFTIQEATREGYTFNGWTQQDVGGASKTITIQKGTIYNKTFTASWTPNTNEIIFNGNGATSGTMNNQKIRTAETKALNTCTFERDEYVFAGWATTANGEAVYPDNANYTMGTNSTYTLYATWKRNVFYISTVQELATINNNSNNNINDKYVLMNDIDLNGQEWSPIASYENPFNDEFDGQGYCISNFIIVSNQNQKGFFAAIENATILNLKLDTISIQNNSQDYAVCGGLVACSNNSTIRNCSVVNSSISFSASRSVYSGGIVGQALSTNILNCCVLSGGVSAISYLRGPFYNYAGGISGSGGIIENCFTTCSVTAYAHENNSLTDRNKNYAGGIVGANATIKKSYATGNVSATGYNNSTIYSGSIDYAGAVAGNTDCTATNCYGYTGQTVTGDYIITPDTTAEISISSMSTIWNYVKNNWSSDIWILSNNANPVLKTNREYYSITYNLNGGINSTSNLAAYHSNEKVLLGNPTRDGYTFDGWYTNSTFTSSIYTFIPMGSVGDIVLYAKWTPNTNEIIFDGNGATAGSMSNQQGLTAGTITLKANQFSRDWYHFIGWSTTADGNVEYEDEDSYIVGVNAKCTLYAVWEDNVKEIYTVDDLSSINDIIDKELYYTYELKNNLTLDDTWVEIGGFPYDAFIGCFNGNNYTITLDLSGDNIKGVFEYNKGEIKNLIVNNRIDVYSASTFGSIVHYNSENAIVQNCISQGFINASRGGGTIGGIVGDNLIGGIIKDCFSTINYNISLSSNITIGGVVGRTSHSAQISNCGYVGAIYLNSTEEINITAGGLIGSCYVDEIDNCYANGTISACSVGMVKCGGLIGNLNESCSISYCYTDVAIDATSTCWKSYAWSACAGGIIGCTESAVTVSNCFVLGNVSTSSTSAYASTFVEDKSSKKFTIENCLREENQKTVSSQTNSTSTPQIQGEAKTKDEILTYIKDNWDSSIWNIFDNEYPILKNTSCIVYNGNGATSGEIIKEIYTNNYNLSLKDNTYTRDGYTFVGWSSAQNGVAEFEPGEKFNVGSNVCSIFYAVWEANTNTLIYDSNGATSGEMANQKIKTDTQVILTSNSYKRDGYVFKGWSLTPEGEVDYLDNASFVMMPDEECVLYAVWEANINTLTFNSNGAISGEMSNLSLRTDEKIVLPVNLYIWDFYTFKGWSSTPDGEVDYLDGDEYIMGINSSYTLYAIWEENVRELYSFEDLSILQDDVNNNICATYVVQNDIDCGGSQINVIGSRELPFKGILLGNNYSIKNFVISVENTECAGFIAYNEGEISNLNLLDYEITNYIWDGKEYKKGFAYTGSLCGINNGIVQNCKVEGMVTTKHYSGYSSSYLGGLIGRNEQDILNCSVIANVKLNLSSAGGSYVDTYFNIGGLLGDNSANVSNCSFYGDCVIDSRTSVYANLGGLIGEHRNGLIKNSFAIGSICTTAYYSSGQSVGGLIGASIGNTIDDCFTSVTMKAYGKSDTVGHRIEVGGLISYANSVIINNSYSSGSIYGESSIIDCAGFICCAWDSRILNSFTTMNIEVKAPFAHANVFRFVAGNNNNTINKCFYLEGQIINLVNGKPSYSTTTSTIYDGVAKTINEINSEFINLWNDDVWRFNDGVMPTFKHLYQITYCNNLSTELNIPTLINNIYVASDEIQLRANTFINKGYSFMGWSTTADGNVVYSDGQKIKLNQNLTLYAVWQENIKTISSVEELKEIEYYLDGSEDYNRYLLINNITIEGDWSSICINTPFSAIFDGNGYTITNKSNTMNYGLFYKNQGVIKNLLVNNDINITTDKIMEFGSIAYINDGVIVNCKVVGNIIMTSNHYETGYIGGVVAENNNLISNCYSEANIVVHNTYTSSINCGGIAAETTGTIINCFTTGNITASVYSSNVLYAPVKASGIVGAVNDGGMVSNCFSVGTMNASCGSYSPVASAIAYTGYDGISYTISNCYRTRLQTLIQNGTQISHNEAGNPIVDGSLTKTEFEAMQYLEFVSDDDLAVNENNVWILNGTDYPKLYWEV